MQSQAVMAETGVRSRTGAALSSTVVVAGFAAILNFLLPGRLGVSQNPASGGVLLAQLGIFLAFVLLAFPALKVASRTDCRFSIAVGLGVLAAGSLLLIPEEILASPMQLPAGLLVMTLGAALLHVSANLQVPRPGPSRGRTARLDLAQGFFSIGAAAGPWICAFLLLPEARRDAAPASKLPYEAAAMVFGILAVAASRFHFPPARAMERLGRRAEESGAFPGRLLQPKSVASAVFCGVGVEMAIACFLVSFCVQPEIGGFGQRAAAGYALLYWAGIVAGRLAGTALLRKIPAGRAVGCVAVAACLLVTASIGFGGQAAIWALILAGGAASMMLPGILTLGVAGSGPVPGAGFGLLLPALTGGLLVPVSQYVLAERIGLHAALVIPAVCCLYLMFYGFATSEPRSRRVRRDERRSPVCPIDSQRRSF